MAVHIRRVTLEDADACGRILSDAFTDIDRRHGFACDFPDHAAGIAFIRGPITQSGVYGIVAELDGKIAGSSFIDERDPVRGIGPVSVHPKVQGLGVGRRLMEAMIDRGRNAPSLRLVQDAFNTASLPLYTSLGFDPIEPLFVLCGRPTSLCDGSVVVRPAMPDDVPACEELSERVLGLTRTGEFSNALRHMSPYVALRGRRLVAYCTTMTAWGIAHGVAETELDIRQLILGFAAAEGVPVQILMPVRQASLFRWCLSEEMRVVKPLTLMVRGEYCEPRGCWFPSAMY